MELTQLKYFAEAAKTENLSKAAINLHISQPSLSKAISKLEDELHTQLFQRDGRKVVLNDNGRAFLEQISPAIAQLQEAEYQFTCPDQMNTNRRTVGIWGSSDALTDCIHAFLREHSDVAFVIKSHIESITRLDIRDFDLLLYSDGDDYFKKYRGTEILCEEYLLAVHKNEKCADKIFVSAGDLASFPMISAGQSSEAERLLPQMNILLKNIVTVDNQIVQKSLVSAGAGVCIVPQSESRIFADDPNIRLLHIRNPGMSRKLKICFKREKLLSGSGREFMSFVYGYFGIKDSV